MKKTRVVITGMGVISPVGNDIATFWDSLTTGKSGIGRQTRFDPERFDSKVSAEVKGFDPSLYMEKRDARKMALFSQYAVAAAVQAWRDAGLPDPGMSQPVASTNGNGSAAGQGTENTSTLDSDNPVPVIPYDSTRIATVIGNGIGGIEIFQESYRKLLEAGPGRMLPMTVPLMIINEAAGNIAMRLGIHGPAFTQATACASGTDAIGQALDMLRAGRCDMIVAGGTEASITEFAVGGFCRLQALSTANNDSPEKACRPFDRDRDGFVIGEGSGMLILERYEDALARKATIYAELAGYGATCDAYHLTAPDPEGTGGARAITLALADAGLAPEDVTYYNAHGTSTQLNDKTETLMVKKAFGSAVTKLQVSSTKSMTGHCVAAAGAIEAIACVLAIRDGIIPPTVNLDNPDIEAGCDLDYVPKVARKVPVHAALSASLGFGGHNGVLAFRKL